MALTVIDKDVKSGFIKLELSWRFHINGKTDWLWRRKFIKGTGVGWSIGCRWIKLTFGTTRSFWSTQ